MNSKAMMMSEIFSNNSSIDRSRDTSPVVGRSQSKLSRGGKKVSTCRGKNAESLDDITRGGLHIVDQTQLRAYALNQRERSTFANEYARQLFQSKTRLDVSNTISDMEKTLIHGNPYRDQPAAAATQRHNPTFASNNMKNLIMHKKIAN